jgi:hypothetical protein
MRRATRSLMSIGMSVIGLAMIAPGPALAGVLDQQQTSTGGGGPQISSSSSASQTFTAGVSGELDQVDLSLGSNGPIAPLTIEIRNVSGGAPGSTILASHSVPISSVPVTHAFVPVSFIAPVPVVAGTQYAIVAYSFTGSGQYYVWTGSGSDSYAGGGTFFASPPSGAWTTLVNDLGFKTYVVPPTTLGPTGQRAAALKKCKKKHSHKKRKKCKKKANLLPV